MVGILYILQHKTNMQSLKTVSMSTRFHCLEHIPHIMRNLMNFKKHHVRRAFMCRKFFTSLKLK